MTLFSLNPYVDGFPTDKARPGIHLCEFYTPLIPMNFFEVLSLNIFKVFSAFFVSGTSVLLIYSNVHKKCKKHSVVKTPNVFICLLAKNMHWIYVTTPCLL